MSAPPERPEDVVAASPLEVVRLGHPMLRTVAEPVPENSFNSAGLDRFAYDMVRTMIEQDGVGLAAPQVAEPIRLFVYWVPAHEDQPEIAPTVLLNPEIRPIGEGMVDGWEGCLSIPSLRGLVPRAERIKVKARALDGSQLSFTADGLHARVLQHEHDHLDGVVFLDRMSSVRSLAFEDEWERYVLAGDQHDD